MKSGLDWSFCNSTVIRDAVSDTGMERKKQDVNIVLTVRQEVPSNLRRTSDMR